MEGNAVRITVPIAVLPKETTPGAIVRYLDQYVIGQDEAKKILAVAVYSHYRKMATIADAVIAKSNVLLVGSSGTGGKGRGAERGGSVGSCEASPRTW